MNPNPGLSGFNESTGYAGNRPKIVCLCGSGRFQQAFERAEFDETLDGKIVLTIGCNTHDVARSAQLVKHKPMLDELHKRKIDLADEVLILNVGGYIGESTRSELLYAQLNGKEVRYLESPHNAKLSNPDMTTNTNTTDNTDEH